MKTKFLGIFVALLCFFALPSCDDNDNDDVNYNDVPSQILNNFKAKYPNVNNVEWERKGNYYVADFTYNMDDMDVWFSASDSSIAMIENDYGKNMFRIPGEVSKAFAESEYGYWTVDDIKYYERTKSNSFYLIEVEKTGQKDMDLYYNPDGTLIKAVVESYVDITPDTTI